MLAICNTIAIFPISGQFRAIWIPDSRRKVVILAFSLIVTLLFLKTENKTKKSVTQL